MSLITSKARWLKRERFIWFHLTPCDITRRVYDGVIIQNDNTDYNEVTTAATMFSKKEMGDAT